MVMVRRSTTGVLPANLATFRPEDWPSDCVAEQYLLFRDAVWDWGRRMNRTVEAIKHTRQFRNVLSQHVDCPEHPPVECRPYGWTRDRDGVDVRYKSADGEETTRHFDNDDPELTEVCHPPTIGPSLSRAEAERLAAQPREEDRGWHPMGY